MPRVRSGASASLNPRVAAVLAARERADTVSSSVPAVVSSGSGGSDASASMEALRDSIEHLRQLGLEAGASTEDIANKLALNALILAGNRLHKLNALSLVRIAREALELRDRFCSEGGVGSRRRHGVAVVSAASLRDVLLEAAREVATVTAGVTEVQFTGEVGGVDTS